MAVRLEVEGHPRRAASPSLEGWRWRWGRRPRPSLGIRDADLHRAFADSCFNTPLSVDELEFGHQGGERAQLERGGDARARVAQIRSLGDLGGSDGRLAATRISRAMTPSRAPGGGCEPGARGRPRRVLRRCRGLARREAGRACWSRSARARDDSPRGQPGRSTRRGWACRRQPAAPGQRGGWRASRVRPLNHPAAEWPPAGLRLLRPVDSGSLRVGIDQENGALTKVDGAGLGERRGGLSGAALPAGRRDDLGPGASVFGSVLLCRR